MTTIDLDATHPSFDVFDPWYTEMQNALTGGSAIKDDEDYLPKPGGMKLLASTEEAAAYKAFKTRASYPEIVQPTVRGLSGVIHSDPIVAELPSSLEYMIEKATTDGLTLEGAIRRITRNVLGFGRTGIAIAIDGEGLPRLAIYAARSIRNWKDDETLVVLDESGPEMKDDLSWEDKIKRRVIEVVGGKAISTPYDNSSGTWVEEEPDENGKGGVTEYNKLGGKTIDFLPFVFIDSNDLTPEPDEVPLLPLARIAATAYRQDANYQQALTSSANPTYVVLKMESKDPNAPKAVGGNIIWFLPEEGQDAKILEYSGKCISDMRQAIQDTMQAAVQAGAKLFASSDEQQESGEARKIKYAAQTATITTIALTDVEGLEKALKMCAVIVGANPDDVNLTISTDFIDSTIGAQEMTAIIKSVTVGLLSEQSGYELFQDGGRANPDRKWEEEKKMIDEQGPALGLIGRDEPVGIRS